MREPNPKSAIAPRAPGGPGERQREPLGDVSGDAQGVASDAAAPLPAAAGVPAAPPAEHRCDPAAGAETAADVATPAGNPLRFWTRPLVLAAVVFVLLALTLWDERRVPSSPVRPDVLTATTPAGATVSASDPGLTDTLLRLRTALARRDARAFANLGDPQGLLVAAFGGGLPDNGYAVPDAVRFSQDVVAGGQITMLGWRNDGRGRVIVLTDGWQRKSLKLSTNSTLELTSLTAIGLVSHAGTWYWRWLLPDSTGVLAQQARSLVWQPWPAA